MDKEDTQEKRGFKVEDRRRFSETGEARTEAPPTEAGGASSAAAPAEPAPHDTHLAALSFSTFVLSLSTQALAHLGEIPHPVDNTTTRDLVAAKQLIDILGILQEKTKGNLDAAEGTLLENMLYDLRLRYVEHVRGTGAQS
jgi:hypothetical protein